MTFTEVIHGIADLIQLKLENKGGEMHSQIPNNDVNGLWRVVGRDRNVPTGLMASLSHFPDCRSFHGQIRTGNLYESGGARRHHKREK